MLAVLPFVDAVVCIDCHFTPTCWESGANNLTFFLFLFFLSRLCFWIKWNKILWQRTKKYIYKNHVRDTHDPPTLIHGVGEGAVVQLTHKYLIKIKCPRVKCKKCGLDYQAFFVPTQFYFHEPFLDLFDFFFFLTTSPCSNLFHVPLIDTLYSEYTALNESKTIKQQLCQYFGKGLFWSLQD